MKFEVFLLGEDGSRTPIWSDANYVPQVKGAASDLLKEAVDRAIKTVAFSYFKDGFGMSLSPISASAGVLKQRINCSGRNVRMEVRDGKLVPVADMSVPDRTFEVELRLDADAIRIRSLSRVRMSRLHIANLRAIRDVTIDFKGNQSWMLIGGLNGTGKTSVLEAIAQAFMKNTLHPGLRSLSGHDYRIDIDFVDGDGTNYRIEKTSLSHVLKDGSGQVMADTDYELRKYLADVRLLFFSSWRLTKDVRQGVLSTRRTNRLRTDDSIDSLRSACINEFINSRLKPGVGSSHYLDRLNAAWRRFYPENDSHFVVAEDEKMRAKANPGELMIDLFLSSENTRSEVGVQDLSSGELEVLSFVGSLMLATDGADIVLIDEPELHLNRAWHATILDVLAQVSPSSQFVATTHSIDVWQAVYSWNRVLLENGEARHE